MKQVKVCPELGKALSQFVLSIILIFTSPSPLGWYFSSFFFGNGSAAGPKISNQTLVINLELISTVILFESIYGWFSNTQKVTIPDTYSANMISNQEKWIWESIKTCQTNVKYISEFSHFSLMKKMQILPLFSSRLWDKGSHYLAPQWWQVVHYSAPQKIWWHNLHCSAPWGKILFGGSTYIIRHFRNYFSKNYFATLGKIILPVYSQSLNWPELGTGQPQLVSRT